MIPSNAGKRRRWQFGIGLLAAIVLGLCTGEAMGWPFLAGPLQRWMAKALEREVSFSEDAGSPPKISIRFLGGIELVAPYVAIGAPAWSAAPRMLLARDAGLKLAYADLWRTYRGGALHIRGLEATQLDGQFERLADGRASWQFGKPSDSAEPAEPIPVFSRLRVDAGSLAYRDAIDGVDLDAKFSLRDDASRPDAGTAAPQLTFEARGTYLKLPLTMALHTAGVVPTSVAAATALSVPVTLEAQVGRTRLSFNGMATDVLHFSALKGRFSLQGPSLAAVGDPLRITLPTTPPFHAEGLIAKDGAVWSTVLDQVAIGSSRLAGAFTFDARPRVPLLAGRLTGSILLLADLGPAVGAPVRLADAPAPPAASSAKPAPPHRVIPDRPFDLPSLRAMDANVLVDIASLDLGSSFLEPLKPLSTHLVLADGVLTLSDLDARTGQGQLGGSVQLDGRNTLALWTADLRWAGVRLESWIRQTRAEGAPPYVTGSLDGEARVAGQGKSTAAILASLHGSVRMRLAKGTVSHLAVEAAGLDIAQGLGVLFKGDDALPIQCAVADLSAEQGVLRPRVLVVDTRDSTLWVDGSASLATEALALRLVVVPKDFSPLALRSPLQLRGTLAEPQVAPEAGPLGARLGAAALLSLINPLAALIPLLGIGNSDDAKRGADECRALSGRIDRRPLAAPRQIASLPRSVREGQAP